MYRVLSCLTNEHNIWLVGLAVFVCVATALTSFHIVFHCPREPRRPQIRLGGWKRCLRGVRHMGYTLCSDARLSRCPSYLL